MCIGANMRTRKKEAKQRGCRNIDKKKEEEKRRKKEKNRDNSAFYLTWDILYMP